MVNSFGPGAGTGVACLRPGDNRSARVRKEAVGAEREVEHARDAEDLAGRRRRRGASRPICAPLSTRSRSGLPSNVGTQQGRFGRHRRRRVEPRLAHRPREPVDDRHRTGRSTSTSRSDSSTGRRSGATTTRVASHAHALVAFELLDAAGSATCRWPSAAPAPAAAGRVAMTARTPARRRAPSSAGLGGAGANSDTTPLTWTASPTAGRAALPLGEDEHAFRRQRIAVVLTPSGVWMKKPLLLTAVTMPVVVTNWPTSGEIEPLPWICAMGVSSRGFDGAAGWSAVLLRPRASAIVPVSDLKPGAAGHDGWRRSTRRRRRSRRRACRRRRRAVHAPPIGARSTDTDVTVGSAGMRRA